MKKRFAPVAGFAAVFLIGFQFVSCASPPAPAEAVPPAPVSVFGEAVGAPTGDPPLPQVTAHEFELRVFELVNLQRANHGLPPLAWHGALATVARGHSADMHRNNFVGHTGSDGSTIRQRIERGGITNTRGLSGIISRGWTTPGSAVESWMTSPGNRAIVLCTESTHIGVGYIDAYWSVKLIRLDPLLSPAAVREFELRVLELTNRERANRGLPPLIWHENLASVARGHSLDMQRNNFMAHEGSDGSEPWDRIERGGIGNWRTASENVAAGQLTPEAVVADWMNSPGHRANILCQEVTHLGVGLVERPENSAAAFPTYWTQKFLRFW